MKTIEQKAKAYDEAVERAKVFKEHLLEINEKDYADEIDYIFPQLKESEDERIRKALIKAIKMKAFPTSTCGGELFICGQSSDKCITWLEKQGEQKPADKIEPKFKVGDYVVDNCGYLWRVEGVINQFYILEGIDGGESRPTIEWVNKTFHLWDITKDAKDGDVLAVDNMIFIYERALASHIVSYCKLINDIFEPFDDARTCCEGNPYVHPATKEQREQLEKAMADAGCTFDFEKKELREIESRQEELTEFEKSVKQVMEEAIECGDTHNLKADANMLLRLAQTPAWSEEDEKTFEYALDMVEWYSGKNEDKSRLVSDWLKSLKERVHPQPKREWSEEDKDFMYDTLSNLTELKDNYGEKYGNVGKCMDWLKSLKDRVGTFDDGYTVGFSAAKHNQWKPSDEQMAALSDINLTGCISYAGQGQELINLYNDLKKLKEE